MDDKYIISTNQQGQPQESKGAVGSPNVAAPGKPKPEDMADEGPDNVPVHADAPAMAKKTGRILPDTSARPMKDKIGKKDRA